mgnify:CR=1 FL=1
MKTETSKLADVCKDLGITIESTQGSSTTQGDDWNCIKFQVEIKRGGKSVWSGPYYMGLACVKLPKREPSLMINLTRDERNHLYQLQAKPNAKCLPEYMSIHNGLFTKLAQSQRVKPDLDTVVNSLLSDGATHFDSESFDDWCSNFGFSNDSIKAEKMWRSCIDTGMALGRAFKREEIDRLREAAQDF